ncbi:MAG: hypothetical protein GF388_11060 [Candidatus Aegiribacteria sp.]|nr:hypothetical protein [Candidatus Aegiribacteria sp.]MBD3295538.1 hypothetical protein [Candidatus Fermentibacteria bacterium]
MSICFVIAATLLATPPPLLEAEDSIARGATAMYTVTLEEGLEYWVLLTFEDGMDLDVLVASDEMNYDQFIQMPYFEDYMYAREFSISEGATEGEEDFVLTAPYTGTAYLIIHDIGETGGEYNLRLY